MTDEELREAFEARELRAFEEPQLREAQFNAALRYIQGVRDHYLSVDWKSVLFYANLFKGESQ